MLSLSDQDVIDHLAEIKKIQSDWLFSDDISYVWANSTAESMANDILKLCKFPPVDGILTLNSETALALISWERN